MFARIAPADRAARYFPPRTGKYELTPGLFAFGADFGNGMADQRLFQLDTDFSHYHENKLRARAESLRKYVLTDTVPRNVAGRLTRFVSERLAIEYPDYFVHDAEPGGHRLHCRLTGDLLQFDQQWELRRASTPVIGPAYLNALDALACQLQEDFAIMTLDAQGRHRLAGVHLCAPNHWNPADKIGANLEHLHQPVPHFAQANRNPGRLAHTMVHKGPYVRFAWGLATDTRLNHHPDAPQHQDAQQWAGRHFGQNLTGVYLRVERQVIWGFPQQQAALFTIRTGFQELASLQAPERMALAQALRNMHADSAGYKGLDEAARTGLVASLQDNS